MRKPQFRQFLAKTAAVLAYSAAFSGTPPGVEHFHAFSGARAGQAGNAGKMDALKKMLLSLDVKQRRKAAAELGNLRDVTAIPLLIKTLDDKDVYVKSNAIDSLGRIGHFSAIPSLKRCLDDKYPYIRMDAVSALKNIGSLAGLSGLVKALSDENRHVRANSAEAIEELAKKYPESTALLKAVAPLGKTLTGKGILKFRGATALREIADNHPDSPELRKAVPGLLESLENQDSYLLKNSIELLGKIKDPRSIPKLIEKLDMRTPDVRSSLVSSLAEAGRAAVPALCDALGSSEPLVAAGAANALGKIKDKRAIKPLVSLLGSREYHVSYTASRALSNIGQPAVPYLLDALQSRKKLARANASMVLGTIGGEDARKALAGVSENDPDGYVRNSAKNALRFCTETIPALLSSLGDSENKIRAAAARKLGETGVNPFVYLEIALMLEKPNPPEAREGAAMALGELGDERAVRPLVAALDDENAEVRISALEALGKIGDSSAVPELMQSLEDYDWRVRQKASLALKKMKITEEQFGRLLSMLSKGETAEKRAGAAMALGELRRTRAIPALKNAMKDKDTEVRTAAAEALAKIRDIALLTENLGSKDFSVRSQAVKDLAGIGSAAVQPLLQALDSGNPRTRAAAAKVLGEICDPAAVPKLIRLLEDPVSGVRKNSAQALGNIADPRATKALASALERENDEIRAVISRALVRIGDSLSSGNAKNAQ
ncbi:hypothetical protein GF318_00555 [Candidatus Micrarchaeota archaeon]|nr:hypothetical protein [Candidatus Micrarchaeota archaeon]